MLALSAWQVGQPAGAQRAQVEPEASTGSADRALARARHDMISTANPAASQAGLEVLRDGGTAADAAIAAELVLGLVEPQSSGLGGGALIVSWDKARRRLTTYDGRETAPASAMPDRFLHDGKPVPFDWAVNSGLSIGTPGLVRALETLHERHGRLPWARLFAPAIRLARDGFRVSPRLALMLRWNGTEKFAPAAARYFFDEAGAPWPEGHLLKNPDYAATLAAISAAGADAFYSGPVAEAIVAAVNGAARAAGGMTQADLTRYKVVERAPLCTAYRGKSVCGMGPPSSGGTAVAQVLKLIEPFDLGSGPASAMNSDALHLVAEAEKLAYADRDRFLADPDFVSVPATLLDTGYLAARRSLISADHAMPPPPAGEPPGVAKQSFGTDATLENVGTSHISVIDGEGNAIAMTATIEGAFGSGHMAAGFLLNNELTDFSFQPTDREGHPVANRVEGGKRPRSSMAPTIVFGEQGEVEAVLGSPGGSRIILYVSKALVALLDWGLDPQNATAIPNFGSMGSDFEIEYTWGASWPALAMKARGHSVWPDLMNSGLHIVTARGGRLEGGADPRREGVAIGD